MGKNLFKGSPFLIIICSLIFNASYGAENTKRIPGVVSGFDRLITDDIVDGALVLKSFTPEDMLNFRVDQFIAPNEVMSAGPKTIQVPGNLYFPKQKENWGFFNITIQKPTFGLYVNEGKKEELVTTSFKVSFSTLADMAQSGQLSPSRLLPLLKFQKTHFSAGQDWSAQTQITIPLDTTFLPKLSFNWNRKEASEGESDHVFVFQQTPSKKWAFVDLKGNVGEKGTLNSHPNLNSKHKALFARITDQNNDIASLRAFIATLDTSEKNSKLEFISNGLPGEIKNIVLTNQNLSWQSFDEMGWLSVQHLRPNAAIINFLDIFGLSFGLFNDQSSTLSHIWLSPTLGSYTLADKVEELDKVQITFIKTDTALPAPQPEQTQTFDDLFDHAQEIRFYNVK